QPEPARALADEAIALAGDARPAVIARRALALTVYHYERDYERSERLLADVVAVAERRGASWIAVEMSALHALVLAARGRLPTAIELAADARAKAAASGVTPLEAWTTYALAMIGLGWG